MHVFVIEMEYFSHLYRLCVFLHSMYCLFLSFVHFCIFFSLIYPEILLGATCNSVYMVLYNLQSTFHMYDIL